MNTFPSLMDAVRVLSRSLFCFIGTSAFHIGRRRPGGEGNSGERRRGRGNWSALVLALGLGACTSAQAVCPWENFGYGLNVDVLKLERIGFPLLGSKRWYENPVDPYPVGTLMGLAEIQPSGFCGPGSLTELIGQIAVVTYFPPANASPHGLGYRIPTTATGVAIDIEFPNGMPFEGGIAVSRSRQPVERLGAVSNLSSGFPAYPLRFSVVKTGPLPQVNSPLNSEGTLDVPGGMGSFVYIGQTDLVRAAYQHTLILPRTYESDRTFFPWVGTPACTFTGDRTITLKAVNASKFRGVGAIADGLGTQETMFHCNGMATTRPIITFEASYPLAGAVGVGLPAPTEADPTSDIGVQIFLDDEPISFGQELSVAFAMEPLPVSVTANSGARPQSSNGFFCLPTSNCSTNMTGPEWIDGAASSGFAAVPIRFKYYQTTAYPPKAQAVKVVFSVNVEMP